MISIFGFVFRIWIFVFGVWSVGICDLKFEVLLLGFGVWSFILKISSFGLWVWGFKFGIRSLEF